MQRTDSGNIRPVVVASVSQPAIAGGSTDQAAASQPMRVRKATIRFDPAEGMTGFIFISFYRMPLMPHTTFCSSFVCSP
jgi:hypothetical protein